MTFLLPYQVKPAQLDLNMKNIIALATGY